MQENIPRSLMQFLYLSWLILVWNCAGPDYQRQQIMQEQMIAITPQVENINPPIPIGVQNFQFSAPGRHLASVAGPQDDKNRPPQFAEIEPVEPNNKVLYFLTLYSQYYEFSRFIAVPPPAILFCPHFHSSLIDQKFRSPLSKIVIPMNTLAQLPGQAAPDLYPERLLIGQLPFNVAINNYRQEIFQELEELCQTGSSNNYFIFENLVRANANQDENRPSVKQLNILLKTTLFSNFALLTGLQTLAANHLLPDHYYQHYQQAIGKRANAPWIQEFFVKIAQRP